MTRAWIWYLAFFVTTGGAACSTSHQAAGSATGACLDEPAQVEEEPVEIEKLAENEAAPAEAEECAATTPPEPKVPGR